MKVASTMTMKTAKKMSMTLVDLTSSLKEKICTAMMERMI